jgi:hypothetical protein
MDTARDPRPARVLAADVARDDALGGVFAAHQGLERAVAAADCGRPIDLALYAETLTELNAAVLRWNDLFR